MASIDSPAFVQDTQPLFKITDIVQQTELFLQSAQYRIHSSRDRALCSRHLHASHYLIWTRGEMKGGGKPPLAPLYPSSEIPIIDKGILASSGLISVSPASAIR